MNKFRCKYSVARQDVLAELEAALASIELAELERVVKEIVSAQ